MACETEAGISTRSEALKTGIMGVSPQRSLKAL